MSSRDPLNLNDQGLLLFFSCLCPLVSFHSYYYIVYFLYLLFCLFLFLESHHCLRGSCSLKQTSVANIIQDSKVSIIKLAWYKACNYSNQVCLLVDLNHATWIVHPPFTASNRASLPSTRGLGSISSISISRVPTWRNDWGLLPLSALILSGMTSFSAILAPPPPSRIGQNPAQTACYRTGDWEAPMNPRSVRCFHLKKCRCLGHFSTLTTTNIASLKTRPTCLARQRQRPGQPRTLLR